MANKHVHAIYDDDDKLLSAVKIMKSKGVNINDVFTCLLYTSDAADE